jgi:hypothetical protein
VSAPLSAFDDFKPETIRGAAGFFRAGQTRTGVWWLLDPANQPFFSCGVNAVNRSGAAGAVRPSESPYAAAVDRRYGQDDPRPFVAAAAARLRDWGFNTLGAGGDEEFAASGLAFAECLDFASAGPVIRAGGARLPDVFDPAWAPAADALAAQHCAPRRDERALLGWFTDHELGWAQPESGARPAAAPTLLQLCLSLEPGFAAYHAAWEFTLALHGGAPGQLAADWEVALPNRETLRELTRQERGLASPGYLADNAHWTREFARRYFAGTAAAVRRHDPHHLILGCRFARAPGAALLAECAWPAVDVLSFHSERAAPAEDVAACHAAAAMPVLLGDFSWAADEFLRLPLPEEPAGLGLVERMQRKGRRALARAVAHPALVGYAWTRWADAPDHRPPFGFGLVHADDGEATEHTAILREVNRAAAAWHAGAADPG